MTATTETPTPTRFARWKASIRVRMMVAYVLLLAAALAIAAVVLRQVLLSRLDNDIDRALTQEIEELRRLASDGVDPDTGRPFGDDVEALIDTFLDRSVPSDYEAYYSIVGGRPFLQSFEAPIELTTDAELVARWAAVTAPVNGSADTEVGEARFLAVPLIDSSGAVPAVFVVVFFPDHDRDEVLQIVRILAVAGGVVLLAAAALAWSLAGRVLRPARQLTTTARAITETDLTRRIPVSEADDELAELGVTFNAMLDRLEDGFRKQRQFLDDVAHELRTPITVARGHLELLGDDPVDRAETIALITDELDRMNRYVGDLLLLARAEEADFLHLEAVDVSDLVSDVLQRAEALGDRRWVADQAPPPGLVAIEADSSRVTQAMLNLAFNAVQHTRPGDEIGIGVEVAPRANPPTVEFWVRDTGPGVDPAIVPRLFERRFRGANSRSGRPDGMGIGLSIVDVIARAHGGRAGVDHPPAGGARFTIVVPIEPSAGPDPRDEQRQHEQHDRHEENVP